MNIKITANQFMLLTEEKHITIEYGSTMKILLLTR